ncbi:Xyloglucanase [Polaribacter huanghezhanensis]|nr:Xyloglucanase [Polaribacter huanghezhanensis]
MKRLSLLIQFLLFLSISSSLLAQDFSALKYRTVGPERGGRVTTVTGTPMLPGTFYLGATGGGVWKSDDYGVSWNNVSDGYFATPSIGAIEVAVNDPNIVYVGTGSDGLRSNVISGKGVYKSINAGKTWEHIGLRETGQVGALEIDPTNHNIVWVAAIGNAFKSNSERGIYKTIDGGKNWKKIFFISDEVGFSDLELLPSNPNIVYAAAWKARRKPWTIISGGNKKEGGIYKSINGGKDWVKLEKGLPKNGIGKIDLAVSPVDSSILYAVIEAPGKEGGLYKSIDQGASFIQVSNNKGLVNRPFYYTNIELDPTNSEIIYSNANPLLKSIDGGKSWKRMSVPHGDNHDIWINPNNPNLLIQANDGGANVTHNGGKTWSSQFNQPTAELYQVEVDDQYPYWLYAGQQDNSTVAIPSLQPFARPISGKGWGISVGGCETGPAVPKPGNHNIVYSNCKGNFGVYNKLTGIEKKYTVGASFIYGYNPKDLKYRFQRVAPIHVSPHNPNVVYHGSQYIHKTMTDGKIWETISPDLTAFEKDKQVVSGSPITRDITGEEYYSTLYSIRESKLKEGLIWTGSNDGVISVTKNGGKSWKNVTPKKLPKGGRVESVEPSQFDPAKAYIAVDRHLLGDDKPYFYKTTNYGRTWELISTSSNGIPNDFTSKVLREDPVRTGLLYAGTEFGMFVSFDDGKSWKKFQQNLPVTPITDIKIFRGDLILSTMGRGFWILDNITTLRDEKINSLKSSPWLFKPDTTIRYRSRGYRTDGIVQYPGTNVIIDYFIPNKNTSPIQLEILDSNRKTVASIVSNNSLINKTTVVENMNLSQVFKYVDTRLETKSGINRFNWNLQQKGAWSSNKNRSFKNGPMVAPGVYTAKLTVNGKSFEQSFEITMDPRVKDEGITKADIVNQIAMQQRVMDLLSEARQFQDTLEKEAKTLKGKKSARLNTINAILKQLKNNSVVYPQQMLVSQISFLLNMFSSADQIPGQDSKNRFKELTNQFHTLKNEFRN